MTIKPRLRKKAAAILLLSSKAFLASIFIFNIVNQKAKAGPQVEYLGEAQLELFDYYAYGDEMLFYLDNAARYSAEPIALKDGMTDTEYIALFKQNFAAYLANFNKLYYTRPYLFNDNYSFSVSDGRLMLSTLFEIPVFGDTVPRNIQTQVDYRINPSLVYRNDSLKKLKLGAKPLITAPVAPAEVTAKVETPSTVSLRPASEYFPFIVISDLQIGDQKKEWFKSGVSQIISLNPELVIINGDMIDANPSDAESKLDRMWSYFDSNVKKKLGSANLAMIPSAGNHDAFGGKYEKFWNSYKPGVENLKGSYPKYYSFDYKKNHFVVLYTVTYNIDAEQLAWLIEDLTSAKGKYNNIFVFGHIPLQQICFQLSHCSTTLKPKGQLLNLLRETGVKFYSSGHHHAYNKGSLNGVDMISSGSMYVSYLELGQTSSGSTYRQQPSFLFIDVNGNKVSAKSYTGTGFSSVFDESNLHQVPGYDALVSVS